RVVAPREELETIHRAAQQAAALTRQLLAFSRQQVPSVRSVDLDDLASQTLRLFGRTATDITVRRVTAPDLPQAWADPNLISQVLLNLRLNARDAMPEGGTITVEIGIDTVDPRVGVWALLPPAGRQLVMAVRDTGIGMQPEQLRRVLEPFYTTKAQGRGTGLGLPMVMSTLEKHGGGLLLESVPGDGTTVTITLPVSHETDAREQAGEDRDGYVDRMGRERVLLV